MQAAMSRLASVINLTASIITQHKGVVKRFLSTRQKFFIKMLCVRITLIQAHTGVILFFMYNYMGKYKNVAMGLLDTLKLIFVFLVTVQKILLEKQGKIYCKIFGKNLHGKKKKIKRKN